MIKLTKTTILRNCQLPNFLLLQILSFKYWSFEKLLSLFLCQFPLWEELWEDYWETFNQTFWDYIARNSVPKYLQNNTILYNPKTLEHFSIQEMYTECKEIRSRAFGDKSMLSGTLPLAFDTINQPVTLLALDTTLSKICTKYRKHWKSYVIFQMSGQTGPFLLVLNTE